VVNVKPHTLPTVQVVEAELMIDGAWSTMSAKLCMAFGFTSFEAVSVSGYVPPVFETGVPERTPLEFRITPVGRVPVSEKVGVGYPPDTTVNEPALPTVKVVDDALVIDGGAG
jgi:hypothetical protein